MAGSGWPDADGRPIDVYTQCPECDAVYRVTSAHLRLAGGEVQCGACGARFDALDRLSDTFPKGPASLSPSEEPQVPARDTPAEGAAPATTETAADEEALAAAETEPVEAEESPEETTVEHGPDDELTEWVLTDTDIALDAAALEEIPGDDAAGDETHTDQDDEPTIDLDVTDEELFLMEELSDQEMPDIADLEFVEGLPSGQGEALGAADEFPPGELLIRGPSALLHWTRRLLLPVLLLALGLAVMHSQRGTLARNPTLAPWLERIYGSIGLELEPSWVVSAYRIIESAAEVDGRGDLQVTLTFANDAEFPQPYPVLRVSLEDRWGDEIGNRELLPETYLAGYVAGQMMSPGRRAEGRATVTAPPGAAVGFRLDLCLPDTAERLTCMSSQP
jgi:predicted Zn finger-like uncharacterized protein